MSSSEPDFDRYKPADVSQEDWNKTVEELKERKTDNENHRTVQLKVKKSVKYLSPLVLIPIILLGYFLFTQYQAILYTIGGIVLVTAFIYYSSVEQGAGEE